MATNWTSAFDTSGSEATSLFSKIDGTVSAPKFADVQDDTRSWSPSERPFPTTAPEEEPRPPTVAERIAAAVAEREAEWRSESQSERAELVTAHEAREAELGERIERAREEGLETGRVDSERVIHAASRQLASSMGQFADATATLVRRYKTEAAELAIELARAVVGEVLRTEPRALEGVIERAMSAVPRTDEVVLRCHPDDVEAIEKLAPTLTARRSDPLSIRLVGDPEMERCGCIIEFGDGAIDARPSVALDMLAEAVRATMASVTAGPVEGRGPPLGVRSVTTPDLKNDDDEPADQDSDANDSEEDD